MKSMETRDEVGRSCYQEKKKRKGKERKGKEGKSPSILPSGD
jgi:hypothetical protein